MEERVNEQTERDRYNKGTFVSGTQSKSDSIGVE